MHWDLLPSFVVLGVSVGSVFALMAIGLVVIYRSTRVLNFAHGSMAMMATVVYAEVLHQISWMPVPVALALGVAAGAGLGALAYALLFRRMAESSMLARILVSLALAGALQGAATSIDLAPVARPPLLVSAIGGSRSISLPANAAISYQEVVTVLATVGAALVLVYVLTRTTFGMALRAVAQNRDAARMLGIRDDRIGLMAWVLGGGLAGLAGILVIPLGVLTSVSMLGYMVKGFVAGVVGGFISIPAAVVGGIVLGVAQESFQASDLLSDYRLLIAGVAIVGLLVFRVDRRFVSREEAMALEDDE